jgi:hypothetical protein
MRGYPKPQPTFANENSKFGIAIQNLQKQIPSITNDIQHLQIMRGYPKPQPTFANEYLKFVLVIQNLQMVFIF